MAKKSNNGLKVLLDIGTILFGVLVIVFMALKYIKQELSAGSLSKSNEYNGFKLISFGDESLLGNGVAVAMLLLAIFAGILAFAGILKLIADLGVVKNKSFSKVANFACIIMAIVVVVMAIVVMIAVPSNCKSEILGKLAGGSYPLWFPLILNLVLGIGATATSLIASKK